jgi:hypothetical protein
MGYARIPEMQNREIFRTKQGIEVTEQGILVPGTGNQKDATAERILDNQSTSKHDG